MADGQDDEQLRLEVVQLAEQLAMEVLNQPNVRNAHDIYVTCLDYVARKIQKREASHQPLNAAKAWTSEKEFMKQRQVAFEVAENDTNTSKLPLHHVATGDSYVEKQTKSKSRPQSAPLPLESKLVDRRLRRRHSDMVDVESSSSSLGAVSAKTFGSQASLLMPLASDDEEEKEGDNDSGFNTSEGVCESTAKIREEGIPTPSSSLLSTSIGLGEPNALPEVETRPTSNLITVREATPDFQTTTAHGVERSAEIIEDDLCTFAYFKSTTERAPDPSVDVDPEMDPEAFPRIIIGGRSSTQSQPSPANQHKRYVLSFIGHESTVTQCRVADNFVATSSKDGTLRIWDIDTGKPLRTLNCKRPIHDFGLVYFRCKLPYLVVCCEDGGIVLIKVSEDKENGKVSLSLGGEYTGHLPNPIRCMTISRSRLDLATGCCFVMNQITKKGRASLGVRGTLKIWDLDTMLRSAEEGVAYDGRPIAAKTMKQLISRGPSWRMSSKACNGEEPILYGFRSMAYLPHGTLLVVGFGTPEDEGIVDMHMFGVLCAKTLNTLWMEDRHMCQITRLTFLPILSKRTFPYDYYKLIVSTFDNVELLELNQDEDGIISTRSVWTKKFSHPHFGSVASPNGKMLASCLGMDIYIYACADGHEITRIENAHDSWLRSVSFSKDSSWFISVGADGSAKMWLSPDVERLVPPDKGLKPRKRPVADAGNSPT